MTDDPSKAPGFWGRLSLRSKTIIVVDAVVLAALAVIGALFLGNSMRDGSSHTAVTPLPSSNPASTPPPLPPFRTSHGLAWIVAACGGPLIIDDLPESPLPHAQDSAVCVVPEGPSVLIGVYRDQSPLEGDVTAVPGEHRSATRTDDAGNTWVFVVEGQDTAPLKALERYGFQLQ